MDIEFIKHGELRPPLAGWELVHCSVSEFAEAICLWRAGSYHWVTRSGDALDATRVELNPVFYPKVADLPDGGFVIAGDRAGALQDQEVNCWTFDANGEQVAEGSVGQGFQHLLTTPAGKIWVGYGDTGVYGGGELARHGLVRFNAEVEPEWLFPFGTDHANIDDCYALNVIGETATTYHHRSFAIAQVHGDSISSWEGSPAGAHGLLVMADRCVLVGSYDDREVVTAVSLTRDGVHDLSTGEMSGLPPDQPGRVRVCRGPEMHVILGSEWFRASMA